MEAHHVQPKHSKSFGGSSNLSRKVGHNVPNFQGGQGDNKRSNQLIDFSEYQEPDEVDEQEQQAQIEEPRPDIDMKKILKPGQGYRTNSNEHMPADDCLKLLREILLRFSNTLTGMV